MKNRSTNDRGSAALADASLPRSADVPGRHGAAGLKGKRVGMVVFSSYPVDPRPRRAAEALLKEGMHVDYLCEGDKELPGRECVNGLHITRLPITHHRGGKLSYAYQYSAFIFLSTLVFAWRSLRHRYDLIYVHNMPDVLVLSALLPKMFGAKVILDQHDPMPELMMTIFNLREDSLGVRVIRRLERWSIARADLVVTVNLICKRLFAARSCRPEKIGVVMNSPDGTIFPYRAARSYAAPEQGSSRPFVIMYHGSLVERNGVDLAVEAVARILESIPDVELRIYGRSTPFLERVLTRARDLGIDKSVRYVGAKRLEELVQEIENCDVGVIPNQRNAFTDINTPTRIFEYLALGKPVIAPSTPGIQDYFDSDSLFFFESGNAADLGDTIGSVYSNSRRAADVADRGQQVYLAHTWEQERHNLVQLVSGLLRGEQA
jgi:glycosyltransferase involved in cell wall biosynthesis